MVHAVVPAHGWRYNINMNHLIPNSMDYTKVSIPCSMVLNRIHITFDGFLTACCQDFNYDLILADLKNTSLREAWYGKNAIALREAHLNKSLDGLLCNNCIQDNYKEYKPLKI